MQFRPGKCAGRNPCFRLNANLLEPSSAESPASRVRCGSPPRDARVSTGAASRIHWLHGWACRHKHARPTWRAGCRGDEEARIGTDSARSDRGSRPAMAHTLVTTGITPARQVGHQPMTDPETATPRWRDLRTPSPTRDPSQQQPSDLSRRWSRSHGSTAGVTELVNAAWGELRRAGWGH